MDVDGDDDDAVNSVAAVRVAANSVMAAAVSILSGALGWPSSGDGAILERGGRCGAGGLQRCGVLGLLAQRPAGRHARTHSYSLAHRAPGSSVVGSGGAWWWSPPADDGQMAALRYARTDDC